MVYVSLNIRFFRSSFILREKNGVHSQENTEIVIFVDFRIEMSHKL